ncbi:TetR/AcrR family transcriptional regulator [Labrys neptuniae]
MNDLNRTSRKQLQNRMHIAETAFGLFEQHGYEAVTMEQIASAADVARGTLYNHFPIKEAVLAYWMEQRLQMALKPRFDDAPEQSSWASRFKNLLEASATWWEGNRQYAAPYIRYRFQQLRPNARNSSESDITKYYSKLIQLGQISKEIRNDISSEQMSKYMHFLYISALVSWIDDEDLSLTNEIMDSFAFFLDGALADQS